MEPPPEPEDKAPLLARFLLTAFPFALLALLLGLDRCGGLGS